MTSNFFNLLSLFEVPILILFLSLLILSFFWKKILIYFDLKIYSNTHRIHINEISRLGGFSIYIFLWSIYFSFEKDELLFNILFSSIPIVFIGLIEDLHHNTSPKIRLISMILSCIIFFSIHPIKFPIIDVPFFGDFINIFPLSFIFFTFSILVVINGMNLIDGLNGLFGFTAIFQLLAIGFLVLINNDDQLINTILIFLIPLLVFLIFNFLIGKVFVGDLGAYFFGFVISILTIYTFGKYDNLFTWLAILILIYPSIELLFSFIRKINSNFSPLHPDKNHLHTLLYFRLFKNEKRKKLFNPLATLLLFIFWLMPTLICIYFYDSLFVIILSIFLFSIIYLLTYYFLSKNL